MPVTNATVNILTAIVSDKYYPQYKRDMEKYQRGIKEYKNKLSVC